MSYRSAMRATLAKLSDKMWSDHARGTYDAVQLNDEMQPLGAGEAGLDNEKAAHADVHNDLRAMLRWYQLATVALGSLLAFVCIAWAAQELGTRQVPMTSFHG